MLLVRHLAIAIIRSVRISDITGKPTVSSHEGGKMGMLGKTLGRLFLCAPLGLLPSCAGKHCFCDEQLVASKVGERLGHEANYSTADVILADGQTLSEEQ